MRSLNVGVVAAVMIAVGGGCTNQKSKEAAEGGKKITVADVPAKVMDSVNGRFPGAQVTSVEREVENGAVVYDFELKQQGRKYETDVKEDGTIMEIEKEVASKDVPAAVSAAVRAKYPQASVKEVMEVNTVKGKQETPDHYEVTLAGGKEVVVSLDGKSVTEEAADEK